MAKATATKAASPNAPATNKPTAHARAFQTS